MSNINRRPAGRQQGFALLVTLLVLVIGAATLYVSAGDFGANGPADAESRNAEVLAQAREIVMARALADEQRPGSLTCASPDTGGSGTFDGDDCDADFGRFPYRTLDSRILKDVDGEPLWYVLDPTFRDRVSQQPINPEEKMGALQIDDREHFAAVIIAPGAPLQDQVDDVRDAPNEYLEAGNHTAPVFTRCRREAGCNDWIRGISVDEIFQKVQRRVVREVAERLNAFYVNSDPIPGDRYLPYAEDFDGSGCADEDDPGLLPVTNAPDGKGICAEALEEDEFPDWILENEWLGMIVYHVDPACTKAQRSCSESTMNLDGRGAHAIVAAPGRPLDEGGFDQVRPGTDIDDYLESSTNRDSDSNYENKRLSRYHNDVLRGVGGEWP